MSTNDARQTSTFPQLKINPAYGIEVNDYQVNFGRAIDRLQDDYPRILREEPDVSIFSENLLLKDDSGVRLQGIEQYLRMFAMMRFLRNSTMTGDEVTFRIVVDGPEVRVRWHAKLWVKDPRTALPGIFAPDEPPVIIIDGVSVYEANDAGFIFSHKLEDVEVTPSSVQDALNGILAVAWPRAQSVLVPVGGVSSSTVSSTSKSPAIAMSPFMAATRTCLRTVLDLEEPKDGEYVPSLVHPTAITTVTTAVTTVTTAVSAAQAQRRASVPVAMAGRGETPMERALRERAEDTETARQRAEQRRQKQREGDGGFIGRIASTLNDGLFDLSPQGCESNYDCERPEVCCDLVFARICCSSGSMIGAGGGRGPKGQLGLQGSLIPIPVPVDDGDGQGRGTGSTGRPAPGDFDTPW